MWNHWLGGVHNLAVDRAAGDRLSLEHPGVVERARTTRHFLTRAVRHLAREAGVTQFLDVGSGLPTAGNTHQIAQAARPEARVLYVDHDPATVRYARELLRSTPEGAAAYAEADLRRPADVLAAARATLDLSRPVALVLSGILGHVPGYARARGIVRELLAALPPGSHLLAHDLSDTQPEWRALQARHNSAAPLAYHLRSPERIAGFFAGLELLDPGVVPVTSWRPDGSEHYPAEWTRLVADVVGGVGRKP
ncbi:SAM-dependent methyltransferase [Streptomyces hoynatensis]|uniref:SAM-dependent methyltransferase n=1 Tax=Streptomyces hoynatensis TaxID=1141874 RepID=A0A3A9ZC35_9ACTN|nr:SAM-dependent methyltransferase [Streptomyces hoynatensis]RKN45881.1 SAM-dependent methyltransferase [Streptomyces hoynatensis]